MPLGPRRNFLPVAESQSQPISFTSTGICPTVWQASSRYGMPYCLATDPTADASYTLPACVASSSSVSANQLRAAEHGPIHLNLWGCG